jgi:hypothetical protein
MVLNMKKTETTASIRGVTKSVLFLKRQKCNIVNPLQNMAFALFGALGVYTVKEMK